MIQKDCELNIISEEDFKKLSEAFLTIYQEWDAIDRDIYGTRGVIEIHAYEDFMKKSVPELHDEYPEFCNISEKRHICHAIIERYFS